MRHSYVDPLPVHTFSLTVKLPDPFEGGFLHEEELYAAVGELEAAIKGYLNEEETVTVRKMANDTLVAKVSIRTTFKHFAITMASRQAEHAGFIVTQVNGKDLAA